MRSAPTCCLHSCSLGEGSCEDEDEDGVSEAEDEAEARTEVDSDCIGDCKGDSDGEAETDSDSIVREGFKKIIIKKLAFDQIGRTPPPPRPLHACWLL